MVGGDTEVDSLGVGVIGLGRMGTLYAEHLQGAIKGAHLAAVAVRSRPDVEVARLVSCRITRSVEDLLAVPGLGAVVIASPTSWHGEHVRLAAEAGKAIFCEKPIAGSLTEAEAVVSCLARYPVPFQVAFQRRFDSGYRRACELIAAGAIGTPEMFRGISCDHVAPSPAYAKTSGGLFWDLGVHDFDAARFLMGSEIAEVFATGANLIDPALKDAGDIDYGIATLRFRSGAVGVIQNSRRAAWGYEIRAEVYGSTGKVVTELDERVPVRLYTEDGAVSERHVDFLDRFGVAYRQELQAFVEAVRAGETPSPGAVDGLRALQAADAATRSWQSSRWVSLADA